jgi:hypothetical protein
VTRCLVRVTVIDMKPELRPTARVLLLDDSDRLLLFRSVDDDGASFWYPSVVESSPGKLFRRPRSGSYVKRPPVGR